MERSAAVIDRLTVILGRAELGLLYLTQRRRKKTRRCFKDIRKSVLVLSKLLEAEPDAAPSQVPPDILPAPVPPLAA